MVFHLGTLIGVQDVFQDKGMESEAVSEFLNIFNLMNTDNIDPCYRRTIFKGKTFLYSIELPLIKILFVVIDDRYLYFFLKLL